MPKAKIYYSKEDIQKLIIQDIGIEEADFNWDSFSEDGDVEVVTTRDLFKEKVKSKESTFVNKPLPESLRNSDVRIRPLVVSPLNNTDVYDSSEGLSNLTIEDRAKRLERIKRNKVPGPSDLKPPGAVMPSKVQVGENRYKNLPRM